MDFVRDLIIGFSEGRGQVNFVTAFSGEPSELYLRDKKYMYHLKIMREAGLISIDEYPMKMGYRLREVPELTWRGQDFLNTLENDTLWNKTKESMKKKGLEVGQVPFEIMLEFAKIKAKEILGLTE